ncbi:MAG: transglycosylase SLT domain-containing protein [Chloroflexi bacterium]|nr:transglycosylase SLT domain-containing protein [Chloroflexota bacterium]
MRYREAAEAYQAYLNLSPGPIDSYVHERRADALSAAGEHLSAIDVYQSARVTPRLGDTLPLDIKIAHAYAALGDHATALVAYHDVYTRSTSDYTKAAVDYLMGQSYTALGQTEPAYAAYLDAAENYPRSYDSYQALIVLVEAGYPVSEFDRGLVDYFAEQYNLSIAAFDRYLIASTEQAGTAYYYKGLAYRSLDNPGSAVAAWDVLIQSYPDDEYWDEAWEQIAYTQWAYLDQFTAARQTLLDFVDEYPLHSRAAEFLYDAARIAERGGDWGLAANLWERIPPEYPASGLVPRAIFLAGISHYRAGDYSSALSTFQWALGSSADLGDQAAALFWIAKSQQALGDEAAAQSSWQQAANTDPTGYYSERARDLLLEREPFTPPLMYDLIFDVEAERAEVEAWMRHVFIIPEDVDLSGPGQLLNDLRLGRGTELWNLGLYEEARAEFESLRQDVSQNPMDTFRLTNYLVDLGLYRPAIFAARQVLTLHGMDDTATMNAPAYFNHLRFGSYYRDLIIPIAQSYDFHPLFLFSVVRQESLFEGFVHSSAGARGLMQIMPATGESIAINAGWPPGYTAEDLYRPKVSITLGADYLDSQRDYFDGDMLAALAAYNAGPGNAAIWQDLSGGDPDLFLEIIRYEETRNYIRGIYEVFGIYRRLYDRTP